MNLDRLQNENNSDRGVSPVVGVILMVAVTVILAAVIGAFVLDLGGNTEEPAQAGVSMSETSDGVQVQWISSGNSESIQVLVDGNPVEDAELNGVGDSVTVTAGEDSTVSVVGTTESGSETTIQSESSTSDTTGATDNEPGVVSGGTSENGGESGGEAVDTVTLNEVNVGSVDDIVYTVYESSDRTTVIKSETSIFDDDTIENPENDNVVVITAQGTDGDEEVGEHTIGSGDNSYTEETYDSEVEVTEEESNSE